MFRSLCALLCLALAKACGDEVAASAAQGAPPSLAVEFCQYLKCGDCQPPLLTGKLHRQLTRIVSSCVPAECRLGVAGESECVGLFGEFFSSAACGLQTRAARVRCLRRKLHKLQGAKERLSKRNMAIFDGEESDDEDLQDIAFLRTPSQENSDFCFEALWKGGRGEGCWDAASGYVLETPWRIGGRFMSGIFREHCDLAAIDALETCLRKPLPPRALRELVRRRQVGDEGADYARRHFAVLLNQMSCANGWPSCRDSFS